MKKLFAVLAATAFIASSAFAELSFSNEISSDIFHITHYGKDWKDGNKVKNHNDTDFAGISNETVIDYTSEKIDVGIDVEFTVDDWKDDDFFSGAHGVDEILFTRAHDSEYTNEWGIKWTDIDWYASFRPFSFLELGLSRSYYTDGSYLPVWDGHVKQGKLGSNGVTVIGKFAGLRVAGTATLGEDPVTNWLGVHRKSSTAVANDDAEEAFDFGLGADYNLADKLIIGATAKDICDKDERTYGAYLNIKPIEGLSLTGGFTMGNTKWEGNESYIVLEELDFLGEASISGKYIWTAGLSYEAEKFSVAADFASNTKNYQSCKVDGEYTFYDMYTAASVTFNLTEALSFSVKGFYINDLDTKENGISVEKDSVYGLEPSVGLTIGNHGFSAGVQFERLEQSSNCVAFPVSWKYAFDK